MRVCVCVSVSVPVPVSAPAPVRILLSHGCCVDVRSDWVHMYMCVIRVFALGAQYRSSGVLSAVQQQQGGVVLT
jgi:hypothetical protein